MNKFVINKIIEKQSKGYVRNFRQRFVKVYFKSHKNQFSFLEIGYDLF